MAPPWSSGMSERGGVGAAIRDGWAVGLARNRPYLALLSGDDQHEPGELQGRWHSSHSERGADYVQGSRWMPGGRVAGDQAGRSIGTRVYSIVFSLLVGRRISDATNGFRIFRATSSGSEHRARQAWLDSYDLEPYVLYKAVRGAIGSSSFPVRSATTPTRPIPRCVGPEGLVAAFSPGAPPATRSQAMIPTPERSFRGRRVLVTGGAGFVGGAVTRRLFEAGARVTVLDDLFTGRRATIPTGVDLRRGIGDRRDARARAGRRRIDRVPPRCPQHHRLDQEPASTTMRPTSAAR